MSEIIPEVEWYKALEIAKLSKRIIILGQIDTGKSTFAKYLIQNIIKEQSVCFIDSDIGQSSIGLPTTIALKVYSKNYINKNPSNGIVIDFDKLFFVGFTTPSISPELFLSEFAKASSFAQKLNMKTVVDTTGFVLGEMAKKIKLEKISILKPDLVIAFERKGELSHILNEIKIETIILTPSKNIVSRSPIKRAEYRMNKFKKYLTNVESYAVSRKLIHGTPIVASDGTIVGLFTEEECIALGVIESLDRENVFFSSPPINIKAIKKIKIGRVSLKGLINETV
ncbi:MAG: Clp1/GlmU family protein [Thermodesulfovibrio sp.]|nr:Clp1/GlmU family protein [Thermodesulfovibrio sp.]MDW7998883.1 Clp1/GlmU family protein [Thermodesulfovibrio sp.]